MSFLRHPIEKWQHELSKASKSGLLACIDGLVYAHEFDKESLMKMAKRAQSLGRFYDAIHRMDTYNADPDGATDRWIARRRAAKKAAAKRKRNAKKGSKGTKVRNSPKKGTR